MCLSTYKIDKKVDRKLTTNKKQVLLLVIYTRFIHSFRVNMQCNDAWAVVSFTLLKQKMYFIIKRDLRL